MPSSVENELLARFESALDVHSLSDPVGNLSYADQQRLKNGEHAALARNKLPDIERSIWWCKAMGILGAALLVFLGVLALLGLLNPSGPDVLTGGFSNALFIIAFMGAAAIGGLWKLPALESRRLLCELVIASEPSSKPSTPE